MVLGQERVSRNTLALRLLPCGIPVLQVSHPSYYDEAKSQVGTGQTQDSLA